MAKIEIKMARRLALALLHRDNCVIRYKENGITIIRQINGRNDHSIEYFKETYGDFEIHYKDGWWKIEEE